MEQIQYLLDVVNGRNYEDPDSFDEYEDENDRDYNGDCYHKPEVHSAATSPKDKVAAKPPRVIKKKKVTQFGIGKKHSVSQYNSPFVQEAQLRARERARAAKQRQLQQPEWNGNTKVPLLFDPNLKKQEIFKLRPRNVPYGYGGYDDGTSQYLPSITNDPTLLRVRKNASNSHVVVQGATEDDRAGSSGLTRKTTCYAPSNNPLNRISTANQQTGSPIRVERLPESQHPSPSRLVRARPSSPSLAKTEEHLQYPYMKRNVHPMSRATSPITTSDLDNCPSLFNPNGDYRTNPYLTSTMIHGNEITRCTSPFDDRELAVLFGYAESQPYPSQNQEGQYQQPPQHFDATVNKAIEVPRYHPSGKSDIETFADIIRDKLNKALSADKRATTPTPKSALKQRSQTPPPPPPPSYPYHNSTNAPLVGSEALMTGMGQLMTAVGDIITASRYPPQYPYYGPVDPHYVSPMKPRSIKKNKYNAQVEENRNLFEPPRHQYSIPFDLASVARDPSQHISSNFLKPSNSKKSSKSRSKSPFNGLVIAPIGAPPTQSRTEVLDVVLQKLQDYNQCEKEVYDVLKRTNPVVSSNGNKIYPNIGSNTLNNQLLSTILGRVNSNNVNNDNEDDDDDDNDTGVKYTPGETDLDTYLSLQPPTVPNGILNHNTYDQDKLTTTLQTKPLPFKNEIKKHSLLAADNNNSHYKVTEEERNRIREVEYLSKFPKVRCDQQMNEEVYKFMNELDLARQMKDVAFQCRGVTMAQVADTATDAIMCKLMDAVTEDVDGFIGNYSDKMIDKI